jgi:hypothetical protein
VVGVDIGAGLRMEGRQLPAVLVGAPCSFPGVNLAALVKVEKGREEIDRGNGHAETTFLR